MSTTSSPAHPASRHDDLRRRYSAAGRFQARMRMRTEEQRGALLTAEPAAASPVRSNGGELSPNGR